MMFGRAVFYLLCSIYLQRSIGAAAAAEVMSNAECLGAFAKFRKATVSFVMSVCLSACNSSATTGRIFMKFDI
jgi:hypothetical protein